MTLPIQVNMTVAESVQRFTATVTESVERFAVTCQEIVAVGVPEYTGAYEATPSSVTQIFETSGCKMTDNFVVNPIPQNYGLITWNGSFITVS